MCVRVGFYLCVSPDPGDSSRWRWVGISLPAEGRHLPVKLCCQHRYAGRSAAQPCAERSGGKNTQTHSTTDACTHRLSVPVFGQVSELYRTGKPIKRIDTASTDEQANRFVREKGWVKGWEAYPVTMCDWQMQICGGEVPQSWPGWQRLRPSALYEGGASALCRRAAESQLNLHGRHIVRAPWFVQSL